MKGLVEFLAQSLVDHPDQVEVDEVDLRGSTLIELRVAPDDLGKVIGRQGRTARAMRTLLGASGAKTGHRYTLDILD